MREFFALRKSYVRSLVLCHTIVCRDHDHFITFWGIAFVYYIYCIVLAEPDDQEIAHTLMPCVANCFHRRNVTLTLSHQEVESFTFSLVFGLAL